MNYKYFCLLGWSVAAVRIFLFLSGGSYGVRYPAHAHILISTLLALHYLLDLVSCINNSIFFILGQLVEQGGE